VISDTDHYSSTADALWAWKSFLRGHHPILMDYGIIAGVSPPDPSAGQQYAAFEAARYAMGDTRKYAERMKLIDMEPRGELSSTGYALANPGEEYLVLQPSESAEAFTVSLAPGSYAIEWHSLNSRMTASAQEVTVESPSALTFTGSFEAAGPAVLYLLRKEPRS
jgi:hypothetical protein